MVKEEIHAAIAKLDDYLREINSHMGTLAFSMKDINLLIGKTRMRFEARGLTRGESKIKHSPEMILKLNKKHDIPKIEKGLIIRQDLNSAKAIVKYHFLTLHNLLLLKRLLEDMVKLENVLIKRKIPVSGKVMKQENQFLSDVHSKLKKMRQYLFALDAEIRDVASVAGNLAEIKQYFFDYRIANYWRLRREIKHETKDVHAIEDIIKQLDKGKKVSNHLILKAIKTADDEIDNAFKMFKLCFLLMHVVLNGVKRTKKIVIRIAANWEIPQSIKNLDIRTKKKIEDATTKLIHNILEVILVLFGEEEKVRKAEKKLKKKLR